MSDESAITIADAMLAENSSSPDVGQSEDGQPSSDCSGSVVIVEEIVTSTLPSSSRQVAGSIGSIGSIYQERWKCNFSIICVATVEK